MRSIRACIIVSLVAAFTILSTSCGITKDTRNFVYLNQGESKDLEAIEKFEPKIQPGDRLQIVVNALNPLSATPYNLTLPSASPTATTPNAPLSYLVEENGTIQFPQLGQLKVAGFTRKDLINDLTTRLSTYIKDPIITINILNFRITVLGEVNRPGTFNISEGKVTLLEAIGLAGDLTIFGRRDNVLLVRLNEGRRETARINLLNKDVLNSTYFTLRQNDVLYVEMLPDRMAQADQTTFRNVSIFTSVATVVTSLLILIVNIAK